MLGNSIRTKKARSMVVIRYETAVERAFFWLWVACFMKQRACFMLLKALLCSLKLLYKLFNVLSCSFMLLQAA